MKISTGVLFIGALFLATVAQAEVSALSAEQGTRLSVLGSPFDDIESLWLVGGVPATERVTGWYTGRCFSAYEPEKAGNSLLVGWTETAEGDGGPLFPPKSELKVTVVRVASGSASYFDEITTEKDAIVSKFLNSAKGFADTKPVEVTGDQLVAGLVSFGSLAWNVREYGDFLYMQHMEYGMVQYYCYYFKKVK